jgi:hypothetical protein
MGSRPMIARMMEGSCLDEGVFGATEDRLSWNILGGK